MKLNKWWMKKDTPPLQLFDRICPYLARISIRYRYITPFVDASLQEAFFCPSVQPSVSQASDKIGQNGPNEIGKFERFLALLSKFDQLASAMRNFALDSVFLKISPFTKKLFESDTTLGPTPGASD